MIYCLIDLGGIVHVTEGAGSYEEVAAQQGLDPGTCRRYRFDLVNRQLWVDRGEPASDLLVRSYVDRYLGSVEQLTRLAAEGRLPKQLLSSLIAVEKRRNYLDACAIIERRYTEACGTDPCLESGCSAQGEICRQPLLRAGVEYHKACAAEWIKLFSDPASRVETWRN